MINLKIPQTDRGHSFGTAYSLTQDHSINPVTSGG